MTDSVKKLTSQLKSLAEKHMHGRCICGGCPGSAYLSDKFNSDVTKILERLTQIEIETIFKKQLPARSD